MMQRELEESTWLLTSIHMPSSEFQSNKQCQQLEKWEGTHM